MGKVGKAAGIAGLAIAGGLALGAKHAINAASNLNEQINKTGVVFGDNATEVHTWSKGLTKDFGISQRAALEAAGTYGNMLKPMGILPAKTKEISTRMVELAGDMASFNNASPEETLDALRAGLAGETEPLRRFGVFLNEATVQAQALSSGIVKSSADLTLVKSRQLAAADATKKYTQAVAEHGIKSQEAQKAAVGLEIAEAKLRDAIAGKVPKLTAAQKALATYEIITKSTKDAQGDFANTSDSVANQQRILKAELEDLSASLGQVLLPIVQEVAGWLTKLTGFMQENKRATTIIIGAVAGLAAVLLTVSVATKIVTAAQAIAKAATVAWTAAQWLLNAALTANPIGLIIVGLVALGAALIIAWKKSETFRDIVTGAWDAVAKIIGGAVNAFMGVLDWVRDHWPEIATLLAGPFAPLVLLATGAFGVRKALADAFGKIRDLAVGWGTGIKNAVVDGVTGIAGKVWNLVAGIGTKVAEMVATVAGWGAAVGNAVKNAAVDAVLGIGNAVWDVINNIGSRILEMVDTVKGWGAQIGGWVKSEVVNALTGIGAAAWGTINNIWEFVSERVKQVKEWGASIGGWIKDALVDALSGLADAIWEQIKGGILGLGDKIKGALGGVFGGIAGAVGDGVGAAQKVSAPQPHPGGVNLMGALPVMAPFASSAAAFGLQVTSGLRPGARTRSGTLSDHAVGKALDVSNGVNTPQMAAFFRSLVGNPRVKQAFYDPLGSIFGGALSSYREGGHSDHVHVATYAKGGIVPGFGPQLAIVHGGETITPRGGGTNVYLTVMGSVVTADDLVEAVRRGLERTGRRNVNIFGGLTG